MNKIPVKNVFVAVFDKSVLDPLLEVLDKKTVKFWGTEGTVKYLKSKGFNANSVVAGFDFDLRVKSLERDVFVRILADRTNKRHLKELKKLAMDTSEVGSDSDSSELIVEDSEVKELPSEPFGLVIVDLYAPDKKNFPENMDIGGQALIRAAVKNYKNVAVAFDEKSIVDLTKEIIKYNGLTTLSFRKKQAAEALVFVAERCGIEADIDL